MTEQERVNLPNEGAPEEEIEAFINELKRLLPDWKPETKEQEIRMLNLLRQAQKFIH